MQRSPTSYLIGIAAGSTEEQDCKIINSKLEQLTGIQGIEVSFQNISLADITSHYWTKANSLATAANSNKASRAHQECKYKWAPNALAVYIPSADKAEEARAG